VPKIADSLRESLTAQESPREATTPADAVPSSIVSALESANGAAQARQAAHARSRSQFFMVVEMNVCLRGEDLRQWRMMEVSEKGKASGYMYIVKSNRLLHVLEL
jgi:hypothetical protein